MKNAQVVSLALPNNDSVLAFDGDNVIDNTDQLTIAVQKGYTGDITVDVTFLDLMSVSEATATGCTMSYQSGTDYWTIPLANIATQGVTLLDKHKYTAIVKENGVTHNMRQFKLEEFCVDNDSFEDTWMHLPYQVEISGGEAWLRWYAYNDSNFSGSPLFEAPAYQGGTGTTFATSAANVTHRGAIVAL